MESGSPAFYSLLMERSLGDVKQAEERLRHIEKERTGASERLFEPTFFDTVRLAVSRLKELGRYERSMKVINGLTFCDYVGPQMEELFPSYSALAPEEQKIMAFGWFGCEVTSDPDFFKDPDKKFLHDVHSEIRTRHYRVQNQKTEKEVGRHATEETRSRLKIQNDCYRLAILLAHRMAYDDGGIGIAATLKTKAEPEKKETLVRSFREELTPELVSELKEFIESDDSLHVQVGGYVIERMPIENVAAVSRERQTVVSIGPGTDMSGVVSGIIDMALNVADEHSNLGDDKRNVILVKRLGRSSRPEVVCTVNRAGSAGEVYVPASGNRYRDPLEFLGSEEYKGRQFLVDKSGTLEGAPAIPDAASFC